MTRPVDDGVSKTTMAVPFAIVDAVYRFLKLMVWIAWDAIRHPLTERTIDYEQGALKTKPGPAQHV